MSENPEQILKQHLPEGMEDIPTALIAALKNAGYVVVSGAEWDRLREVLTEERKHLFGLTCASFGRELADAVRRLRKVDAALAATAKPKEPADHE